VRGKPSTKFKDDFSGISGELMSRTTIADAPLAPDITGENHRGKGYYNRCWPVTHVNDGT